MTHEHERRNHEDRDRKLMVRSGYRVLLALSVLALATGTIVYRLLEDWSWADSFSFSAIAVTTVRQIAEAVEPVDRPPRRSDVMATGSSGAMGGQSSSSRIAIP